MGTAQPSGRTDRLGRRVLGTRLFLVSYTPLWIIFAIRSEDPWVLGIFASAAALGVIDAVRLISAGLQRSVRHITFDSVADKGGDAAGYLASYLLPFIGGPPGDGREAATYAVYFLVAWCVFVPSDLVLVNPTMYVLGWRIVEAERDGERFLVLCQDPPVIGAPGAPVANLPGSVGWVQRPSRAPWTWVARRAR